MKKSYIALLFLAVIVSFSCTSSLYYKLFLKLLPYLFYSESSLSHSLISIIKTIQRVLISKISRKAILSVRKTKIHLSLQQISTLNLFNKKTRIQSSSFFITFLQIIMLLIHLISLQILVAPLLLVQEMPYLLLLFSALQLDNQSFLLLRTR